MAKSIDPFVEAVNEHRARLLRVVEQGGVGRLKRVYDQAQDELARKLRSSVRSGKGDTFTAHHHRIVLAQVRDGQKIIAAKLGQGLTQASVGTRVEAVRGFSRDVTRLEKHFTGAEISLPTEEAAIFAGVVGKRETSLIRMHQSSLHRYGDTLATKMEDELAVSLISDETPHQAIDRIQDVADNEWWQAERIARTELSYAASASTVDSALEAREEIPDLMLMWQELCGPDGTPLDDRVAVDSIAMHGQVAAPGEPFTMPDTAPFPDAKGRFDVPPSLAGLSWTETPCRPNGRECLVSWRPDWGIPGWVFRDGDRVPFEG
jgi:hypothetical protein